MSSVLKAAPSGPIAARMAKCRAFISGAMGPVGSGKTTAMIQKCIWVGLWQNAVRDPARENRPVRRAKIAVVRDTYPNLDATVIESWHRWFPADKGEWVGGAPRTHKLEINLGAQGILILEMIFVAIGDKRVEDVLRGLEVTAIWLNECDRLSFEVLKYALGRVGRYPGSLEGGCAWSGVFADFNAPDEENWTYKLFVEKTLDKALEATLCEEIGCTPDELIAFHRQPGGREPGAENLHNLPKGYYARQMIGATADYIRRMIDNLFGATRHGQPVYPEFKDTLHVSELPLDVIPNRRIRVGLDGGLTPAGLFKQTSSLGQHRILRELVVWSKNADDVLESVGPTRYGQALRQFCLDEFPTHPLRPEYWDFRADPATRDGTDDSENELSWLQIVERELNGGNEAWSELAPERRIRIRPASTNVLNDRLESVRKPMTYLVEGAQPAFLLDKRCKVFRRGLNSGYHYRRVAVGGTTETGRFDAKPAKNMFSHVQDAGQYAFDEGGGNDHSVPASALAHRVRAMGHAGGPLVDRDYAVFGGD